MNLDDAMINKVSELVDADRPVTQEVFLQAMPLEIPVNGEYTGYANVKVTRVIDSLTPAEVTHLKFIPMKDEGYVIIAPAAKGSEGAVEFTRSASRRTGVVKMRAALLDFNLRFPAGRSLRLPVTTLETKGKNKRTVMLMQVKQAPSKRTSRRAKKAGAAAAAGHTG